MSDRQELYRRMLFIRRVEEGIREQYPSREMRSPPHLCMGHEAIAVGVCSVLRSTDLVYPYYRSHGWYLAKGGNLRAMLAELFGRSSGCSRGWGGSMHLIDLDAGVAGTSAIVAGTISHATGAALTFRMRGEDRVAISSFGDGATEEGVFHEALNFAMLRRLPVVFVCENNLYATNTHIRERQAQTEIHRHAERFGMPSEVGDGNDVMAVERAAERAVLRARRGEGPTLLEFHTYRILEHCGINEDHDLGYRTREEVASWHARGPIDRAANFVKAEDAECMEREIKALVEDAFAFARAAPWPTSIFPEAAS
jgi:pyruvate dehydrogenase E1 component alpha subunit